jgi:pyrroline-5-carboxylate reductase
VKCIGFIGTGHLASFLIEGLRHAGAPYGIVVSPRNADTAARLSASHGVSIAVANQAVADAAEVVVMSVLPRQASDVMKQLRFKSDQLVISSMAGVSLREVGSLSAPARAVIAMMPGRANALAVGPTALHPPDRDAEKLFSYLGPVHAYKDERMFAAAGMMGAFSGMSLFLMAEVVRWFSDRGLEEAEARRLIGETIRGNGEVVISAPEPMAEIVCGVASPGGETEFGVSQLNRRGALSAWREALDSIYRLRNPTDP